MIAGTGGDSGKTLVALGLTGAWRREGLPVATFKKGPDYIDPAWLKLASGRASFNLDTWMMGSEAVLHSFKRRAESEGVNIIEANRGLHDGEDAWGTHSSAELAKLLKCPVLLVLPVVKVTRTAAAIAWGIKMFDPAVNIAGVILNQAATKRQMDLVRRALEEEAGIKVLGILPRLKDDLLPGRHLGLVTPEDHQQAKEALDVAAQLIADNVDLPRMLEIARQAELLYLEDGLSVRSGRAGSPTYAVRIGYFSGPAFTFYYPDNLEALSEAGAEMIPIDPFLDNKLPPLDGLYIGGGFPETHAQELSENRAFRESVREAAEEGLPIYAECGGLMFLCRSLRISDKLYAMTGVLEEEVEMLTRPQGHGYETIVIDAPNPFFTLGSIIKGHEFHYSKLTALPSETTAAKVERGVGLGAGRDGIMKKNVFAAYMHLHVNGAPQWTEGMISAARKYRQDCGR